MVLSKNSLEHLEKEFIKKVKINKREINEETISDFAWGIYEEIQEWFIYKLIDKE